MTKRRYVLALLAAFVLALGCAKNPNAPASISGKVNYKGQPLKGGKVTFHTKDAGMYTSAIDEDGTYSITDLPTGDLVVTVETESVKPKEQPTYGGGKFKMKEYRPPGAPADAGKGPDPSRYVKVPSKYSNPKTSPLTVTVSSGRQVKEIELTD